MITDVNAVSDNVIAQDLLNKIVEGALFAAGRPLTLPQLGALFHEDEQPSPAALKIAIETLQQDYAARGLELVEIASGYRFQVRSDLSRWMVHLWEEKPPRYSRAVLETLVLIAYRQPITRAEIEEIRGVSVSTAIMKMLQEREWVRIVGQRDVPGKPSLYATTRHFLDYFNLRNLNELPTLAELRDDFEKIEGQLARQLELDFSSSESPKPANSEEKPKEWADNDAESQVEEAELEETELEEAELEEVELEEAELEETELLEEFE